MQDVVHGIHTFKHYNNPSPILILKNLISANKYDAIHLHGYNGKTRLWIALKLAGKNLPTICSSRDQPRKGRFFRKMFWNHFNKILVPNKLVRDLLFKSIGKKDTIRILHPQVDTDQLRPLENKNNKTVKIGLFARFDPIKAFPIFFEACQKVIRRNPEIPAEVVIAGTNFDAHKQELKALIQRFNLTEKTEVIGFIPHIGDEISKLDIGVISSIGSEELSRIGLEYMACGVPVVSTDVGGLPELISEKEGRVVPCNSADQLANAIEELLKDPKLRKQLGKQARQTAEEVYSVKVHCQKLEDIINSTLPVDI